MSHIDRPPILGIDLGASKCLACVMHQGVPLFIRPSLALDASVPQDPATFLPSAFCNRDGQILVGQSALNDRRYSDQVVLSPKRYLALDNSYLISSGNRTYSPSQIIGEFVRVLVRAGERELGLPEGQLREAVVTVPADFGSAALAATRRACQEYGGLARIWFIDEPIAATYSLGIQHHPGKRRVLVAHLGASSFDVTLLRTGANIGPDGFEELGREADSQLGGLEWDREIAKSVLRSHTELTEADIARLLDDNNFAHNMLFQACQAAKQLFFISPAARRLAAHGLPVAPGSLPPLRIAYRMTPDGPPQTAEMPAALFITSTAHLVERCVQVCERLFESLSRLTGDRRPFGWAGLDSLIMTGGGSRMATLQRRFYEILGRPPILVDSPSHAAAKGAALFAQAIRDGTELPRAMGRKRYPHKICVLLSLSGHRESQTRYHVLVERKRAVPFKSTFRFPVLGGADRTALGIPLAEAEFHGNDVVYRDIGVIQLRDLPQAPAGIGEMFTLTVDCDENAELSFKVEFRDRELTQNVEELALSPREVAGVAIAADRLPPRPVREDPLPRAIPTRGPSTSGSRDTEPPARPSGRESAPLPIDEVQFTVYCPKRIRPKHWYTILAFVHLADRRPDAPAEVPDPITQVRAQAEGLLGPTAKDFRNTTIHATQAIPQGAEITLLPDVPGIEFNPERRVFRWMKDVHREEFDVRAPAGPDGTIARGRLSAYLGVILLAEVNLAIKLDSSHSLTVPIDDHEVAHSRPYRNIFASYSHKDAGIVSQVESWVQTLGDRYLRDVIDLRAGENWDDRLLRLIEEADIFQLFWSSNSMRSGFVRREWEHALSLARAGFIRPTYWEDPLPSLPDQSLPPESLRRLHFHRISLDLTVYAKPDDLPNAQPDEQHAESVKEATQSVQKPRPEGFSPEVASETPADRSSRHPQPKLSRRWVKPRSILAACFASLAHRLCDDLLDLSRRRKVSRELYP